MSRGHDSVVLHDDVSIVMTFFICSQVKMDIEKSVETLKFDMSAVLLLGQNPTRHDTTRSFVYGAGSLADFKTKQNRTQEACSWCSVLTFKGHGVQEF